jgi:hypothetical protein
MRLFLVIGVLVAALVAAPTAGAKPAICKRSVVRDALLAAGKLTPDSARFGEKVDLIRCGDVTGDGVPDAVFTIFSGGTAGDTHFGVLEGPGQELLLFKPGYKVGVALRDDGRSFETLQPHYRATDPNCCPSSFRKRRYTWTGNGFKRGKAKKLHSAPRRFYRP